MDERLSLDAAQTMTLPRILRWRAARQPEATALREKSLGIWRGISWRQYNERARCVAMGFHALGLCRGDRIAIAAEGMPEWFLGDLGAQMLGLEVVGIYPTNPWAELQYIVRHCQARLVICGDQEQTDKVLEAMKQGEGLPDVAHVVCVDTKGMRSYDRSQIRSFEDVMALGHQALSANAQAADWLDREIDAAQVDDVNALIYTSGTTGPPKGAMLTHRNLSFVTSEFVRVTGLEGKHYESVCYLPLCHVAERSYSMVMHLLLGGVVNFAESIDTVAVNIREIAPTFFLGVPRIWEKLQQNIEFRTREAGNFWRPWFDLGMRRGQVLAQRRAALALEGRSPGWADVMERCAWHWLLFANIQRIMGLDRSLVRICGGASVSPQTLMFFEILGLQVCQGYGLTETTGIAFVQRPGAASRVGSCGHALGGVDFKLADDGEILIRAASVFKGYLRDPQATAATVDAQGWLRTGDIGQLDEAGELMIVDRKKAIIITSGGKNIAPSEIENALRDSAYIREAIVVGEGRKYLGGLIQIDFDTVGRWASENDIGYTSYRSLAQHPRVRQLIAQVVDAVNQRFARVENIRRFVILEKELDHDDGELTATQKIRRSVIEHKFARELAIIYDAQEG